MALVYHHDIQQWRCYTAKAVLFVCHICLVVLIKRDRAPESLQWHDVLLESRLLLFLSHQLLTIEQVVRCVEIKAH